MHYIVRHKPPLENDLTAVCFLLCITVSPGGHCFSSLAISAATVPPHFPLFPSLKRCDLGSQPCLL